MQKSHKIELKLLLSDSSSVNEALRAFKNVWLVYVVTNVREIKI